MGASTNARSGCCFPSYEAIATRAECARSTVAEALKAPGMGRTGCNPPRASVMREIGYAARRGSGGQVAGRSRGQ